MPGRTWPVTTRQNSPPLTVSRQRRVAAAVLRVPGVLTCRTHTIQSQVNAVFFVLNCSHTAVLSGRRALLRSPARPHGGKTWVLSFTDMFSPQARAARRLSVRAGGGQSPAQCCAAGDSEGAPTSSTTDRRMAQRPRSPTRARAQANTPQTRTQFQRSASRQNK